MDNQYYGLFIAACILSNTLVLSLDRYPETKAFLDLVEKLNLFFALIFMVDLVLKLLAFGVKGFFRGSWFNTFDFVIVLTSTVDLILSNLILSKNNQQSGSLVTALRGFRLLRVFKLAKQWKRFELLLETMGKALKDIVNFAVFLFLFIFIFVLLALEVFAYKCKINLVTNEMDPVNGSSPTFNFDTFMNALTLVFIILTNDAQSGFYYDYYRAVGATTSTIFWMLLVLVG